MIVGNDQLDAFQATSDQAIEEGTPMHPCLGQRHRYAEHVALAVPGNADGDQHGAIDQLTGLAHPLVAGIKEQVRGFVERPFAPGGEPGIELLGGSRRRD